MRDVALVPEGYVFESDLGVGADDAGEAADLLRGDGIALVGHGAGAFLAGGEEFFGFADFGALEVANFGGDLVESGAQDGEGGDVGGVAVALKHLGADGSRLETEGFDDGGLVPRAEVAEAADGTGDFADADVFGGGVEAAQVAAHFAIPEEKFHAKGGGFGMDAVGAADGGGVLELQRAALEDFAEAEDAFADDLRGFHEGEGLGGVDDVGGGEAEVEPAGGVGAGGLDVFGDGGGEGENVVAKFAFEGVDTVDGEGSVGA